MNRTKLRLAGYFLFALLSCVPLVRGQDQSASQPTDRERALLERIERLEQRLSVLEAAGTKQPTSLKADSTPAAPGTQSPASKPVTTENTTVATAAGSSNESKAPAAPSSPLAFSDGTTLNFDLDFYYGYNFNHPVGRVNLLRANDVLSDSFSLNQVGVIVERAPDPAAERRLGYRVDLMFGQNTDTLQGGAQNEPRPQIYRNIFQAYGSYVLPLGSGLQLDFGKFASSLGYEGNYNKDQFNYSRSYFFTYLPYYHTGLRSTYNVNSKLALQYWLVNGVNESESFNGWRDQAVLLTYKPASNISWNVNYYEGQEQRDVVPDLNPGLPTIATQPGLSTIPVTTRHDGRLHVIDSYASFNLGPKWTAVLEGDWVINRVAANGPPSRVYGGAGYLHRQLTNTLALNGRFEYLKDKGGLFSFITQDLKEVTGTAVYQIIEGFQTKVEYRRDFSNQLFFLTNNPAAPARSQTTATLGLVWWLGGKTGSW